MLKWWDSKGAAWGEALILQALGYFFTRLNSIFGGIAWGLLFLVGVFLIWRAYRKRNVGNGLEITNYADKIIVDSKVPAVLEITNTLQRMADYHNIVLNKLLNKKIKRVALAKIQTALRKKLNLPVKDSKLGNSVKIDIIQKQMKKLGIYTKDFNEGVVPFLVEVTWVLDELSAGIPQYLEDEEYKKLHSTLNQQTSHIAGDTLEEMILIYEDLGLGFNSMIAYINYFSKADREQRIPEGFDKSTKQLKYERDQILKTYLQKISKEIEAELKSKKR